MSFVDEEDILKAEKDDIEKLNAFLNCEELSDDSDDGYGEDDFEVDTRENIELLIDNTENVNIELNDVTLYDEQVQTILSKISTVNLNTVLVLNKAQQNLLIEAINKFRCLLKNCEEQLTRITIMKNELSMRKRKNINSSWYRCGVPYFKNVSLRHNCPSNSDTLNKIKNGELALIDLPPCRFWLVHEKEILKKIVCAQSKQIRIRMQRDKLNNDNENMEWNNKSPEQCVFPVSDKDVLIDWLKISIHDLKCRHTDEACKAMWYEYLHPHLNHKPYGPREIRNLKEIAAKYNYQNWDAIANELGTSRSGYHCCLFYRLNVRKGRKRSTVKWTPEEDAQLKSLVDRFKIGNYIPWGRITYFLPNREKAQIYTRYHQSIVPEYKKGKFSKQEDLIILSLAKKFGDNFQKIGNYFKDRSVRQIRARYINLIEIQNCKFKTKPWTEEEDRKIIEFVKAHSKPDGGSISWSQLEKELGNPHRNRTNIRHRWGTIKNYLNNSYEGDLSVIPRPQKTLLKANHIKPSHLDNVLTILNNEESKNCNVSLTNITEEVLQQDTKKDLIDQFKQFFISRFSKIRIDHPIEEVLEIDIVNAIFLINILNGCLNIDLLLNKKFKNCYTEKNEIIIVNLLKGIVDKLKEHSVETLFNTLKNNYSLPYCLTQKTISVLIPKCFISIHDMDRMIAAVKPFLKYVMWKDSKLDTFYVKLGSRYVRDLKAPIYKEKKLIPEFEESLITSAMSVTCSDFLNSETARMYKSARVTEIFKVRYLSLFIFKSMESIVHNLTRKSMEIKFEYIRKKVKKPTKVSKRGRPRKMLPGGRFKYKKEVNDDDDTEDEIRIMSLENDSCYNVPIKSEKSSTPIEVTSFALAKNIKSEIHSEDSQKIEDSNEEEPMAKKIKLSIM